jgi:hypothetical protein
VTSTIIYLILRGPLIEALEPLANSMMVLMVRGLFSKLHFAYAQFPCSSIQGHQLYDLFWEAVERLERCGFRVLACTCDGLSVNRKFFKLHGKKRDLVHKVLDLYSSDGRYMFLFSDPPHLLKTVRNCWVSGKRLMCCTKLWEINLVYIYYVMVVFPELYSLMDNIRIQWSHLVKLYRQCRPQVSSPGLSMLSKLKYEHIVPTIYSKMRVDLAAQVAVHQCVLKITTIRF